MKVFLCEPIHPAAYRLLEQNGQPQLREIEPNHFVAFHRAGEV